MEFQLKTLSTCINFVCLTDDGSSEINVTEPFEYLYLYDVASSSSLIGIEVISKAGAKHNVWEKFRKFCGQIEQGLDCAWQYISHIWPILLVEKVKLIKNKNKMPEIEANKQLPYWFLNRASLFSKIFSSNKSRPIKSQLTLPL